MWTTSSSPASNFFRAAEARANSIDVKRYSLSMSFSRWRASMIRRISAPSMKELLVNRASRRATGGPRSGSRSSSATGEPGGSANGQSAAHPGSTSSIEPETKRSGRGPLLHAAPEKNPGIVARAERAGQPQAPVPADFATAARRSAAAVVAIAAGLLPVAGAQGVARDAPDGATAAEVAARFVRAPAGAAAIAASIEGATATEELAAALLAPPGGAPPIDALLARPEVALELLRRLPRPTPTSWLPALSREVGRGGIADELLLEWIAKAPPAAARPPLRAIANLARTGRAPPQLCAAADNLLAALEEPAGAADLFADELRPEPDVTAAARHAFDLVVARARADERAAEVADLERQL